MDADTWGSSVHVRCDSRPTHESLAADRVEETFIADDLFARWNGNPQIAQRYSALVLLRCRLQLDAGESKSAPSLVQSALERSDLIASDDERLSLQHFARP